MAGEIFISYRRKTSELFAYRLVDRLLADFGRDAIFFDKDHMPFTDFRVHIGKRIRKARVVLVLIDDSWSDSFAERKPTETDYVRIEIETALAEGIPIAPILVGGAAIPEQNKLPLSLSQIPFINAERVSPTDDFHFHVARLSKKLVSQFGITVVPTSPTFSSEHKATIDKLYALIELAQRDVSVNKKIDRSTSSHNAIFGKMLQDSNVRAALSDIQIAVWPARPGAASAMEDVSRFVYGERMGRIEVTPVHRINSQHDLANLYSPGVAMPVLAIANEPSLASDLTSKGNLVAIATNGTSLLGLGNMGSQAAKPVMEAKAALMKWLAHVDAFDLELAATSIDEFVNCLTCLGPTFGAICLEDIRAPDCFVIEDRLQSQLDIPVYHDDQHSGAICVGAALLNAISYTGRKIETTRLVVIGAGASALAAADHVHSLGIMRDNIVVCDIAGVIYKGRDRAMNPYKAKWASHTAARTYAEALEDADVLLGFSTGGIVTASMVKAMASAPIIFAMANPEPEIRPELVATVKPDAIVATGRSDYPNFINNLSVSPFLFRGLLDVRATCVNKEMKCAASVAMANLAREGLPPELAIRLGTKERRFGAKYIIPDALDPRLISRIAPAVAEAALRSGSSRGRMTDFNAYSMALARMHHDMKLGSASYGGGEPT